MVYLVCHVSCSQSIVSILSNWQKFMEHPTKPLSEQDFFSPFETLSNYYLLMFMSTLQQSAPSYGQQLLRPSPF